MIGYPLKLYWLILNLNYDYATAVDICQQFIYWNEKISLTHESWESSCHWSFILMEPVIMQLISYLVYEVQILIICLPLLLIF
jgi:hypothetical protein